MYHFFHITMFIFFIYLYIFNIIFIFYNIVSCVYISLYACVWERALFIVTANWWICIVESMETRDLSCAIIVERDLRTENSCVIIRYSNNHIHVRCDALWFGGWVLIFWRKLKKKGQQVPLRHWCLSTKEQGSTSH